MICLDLSVDGRFLVAVGLNSHSQQLIILWNITTLLEGDKVNMSPTNHMHHLEYGLTIMDRMHKFMGLPTFDGCLHWKGNPSSESTTCVLYSAQLHTALSVRHPKA